MKNILLLFGLLIPFFALSQVRPDQFPVDGTPSNADAFYTQEAVGGIPTPRKMRLDVLKAWFTADSLAVMRDSLSDLRTLIELVQSTKADSLNVLQDSIIVLIANNIEIARDTVHSAGGGGVGAPAVDTLPSYTALRAYTDTLKQVFVQDFTYTYSGTEYTTLGGLFSVVASFSGNPNNALTFTASDGRKWKRITESKDIKPEWWEVGGYDYNNVAAGIKNERDRIYSAIQVANVGGTVFFQKNKTYSGIDIALIRFEDQVWKGNGATLKRSDLISEVLTANASAGATTVTVASTAGFRVGQKITIADAAGDSDFDTNTPTISSMNATTLTFSPALASSWVIGDDVFVICDFIAPNTGTANRGWVENLTFDGNRLSNTLTQSWQLNGTATYGSGHIDQYKHCKFENTPCENIQGYASLDFCEYDSLGGSFIHFGEGTTNNPASVVWVKNCKGTISNLNTAALAGHSEALIIFSSNVNDVTIRDNKFSDGRQSVIDDITETGGRISIINNEFRNFDGKFLYALLSGNSLPGISSDILIEGNKCFSCGDMIFYGNRFSTQDYRNGYLFKRLKVINNDFHNSRALFGFIGQLEIEGNNWYNEVGVDGFTGFKAYPESESRYNGMVTVMNFDQFTFTGNSIHSPTTYKDTISYGLKFVMRYDEDDLVYSAIATPTEYFYPQGITVSKNQITNFRYGIGFRVEESVDFAKYQFVAWNFTENYIQGNAATIGAQSCMEVLPGIVATGNTLINTSAGSDAWGAVVSGVLSTGSITKLHGGYFTGNTIYGQGGSIKTRDYTATNRTADYNAVITGNFIQGALTNTAGANSAVYLNTKFNSALIPSYSAPENPALKEFLQNPSYY